MEFEWDHAKDKINQLKHGYSFDDASEAFSDQYGLEIDDPGHSDAETRFYWVGKIKYGAVVTIWFTQRENKIRIIGCANFRKMRRL